MESQSLAAGRPKRNAAVPERARTAMDELKGFRSKRKQIETSQKRKTLAEDRDTTSQIEDEGSLKRQRSDTEALGPYESCETDAERMKWLIAAILARNGEDLCNSNFTIEELEEQWLDPQVAEEPGPDRYPGIAVGPISHTMDGVDDSGTSSTYKLKPGKLIPTDSTTISDVGLMIYRHPRSVDGKHNEIEGYANSDKAGDKTQPKDSPKSARLDPTHDTPLKVGKLRATDSTTISIGQPRVYHNLRESDGKHKGIEGYTAHTQSSSSPRASQGYMARRVRQPQERVPIDKIDMRVTPVPQPQPQNNNASQIVRPLQLQTPPSSQQDIPLAEVPRSMSPRSATPHSTTPRPQAAAPCPATPRPTMPCPSEPRPDAPPLVDPLPAGAPRVAGPHTVATVPRIAATVPRTAVTVPRTAVTAPRTAVPRPTEPRPVGTRPAIPRPTAPHAAEPRSTTPHPVTRHAAEQAAEQAVKPLTKKQMAQLHRFGHAKQLVKLLAERIKVRAVVECAYADVLPPDTVLPKLELESKKQSDQQKVPLAPVQPAIAQSVPTINVEVLSDKWVIDEWVLVNNLLRPGVPMLELKQEYAQYVREDFSGIRNYVKTTITGLVHQVYNFKRGYSDENKELVESLLDDAFHSRTLQQPDKYQFHHDIIVDAIQLCWFGKKKIGIKHAGKFKPMPFGPVAFVCTIIHFLIQEFSTGEHQRNTLDADVQSPMFESQSAGIRVPKAKPPPWIYTTDSELEETDGEENGDFGMGEGTFKAEEGFGMEGEDVEMEDLGDYGEGMENEFGREEEH